MTISSVYAPDTYSGNGSTDTFAITFPFLSVSTNVKVSIKVVATGVITLKTAATHYNVSGSNVVFTAGNIPATGETVIIELDPDFTQDSDYATNAALPAETLEADLDERCLEAQINKDRISRAIKVDSTVDISTFDTTLPDASANAVIGFNSSADGLSVIDLSDTSLISLPVSTANGGLGVALSDPGADRLLFWDDSAGAHAYLTAGAGLTITGTTITSSADLVNDTTPQLGGTLDVNGNTIGDGTEVINMNGTALSINNGATGPGELRLVEDSDNGSNYLAFKAPSAVTTTTTFTLPDGDGTSTQVLQTNGSGTLSWVNAGSGGRVLISSATASASASIEFTSGIDSTYDYYEIAFVDLHPATTGVYMKVTFSSDGGSTYHSTNYDYGILDNGGGTTTTTSASAQTFWQLNARASHGFSNVSNRAAHGLIRFFAPSDTTSKKMLFSDLMYASESSGTPTRVFSSGYHSSVTGVLDAVKIEMTSGNITSGEFYLYGFKKS